MPADTPPPVCSGRYVVPATCARSMGGVGSGGMYARHDSLPMPATMQAPSVTCRTVGRSLTRPGGGHTLPARYRAEVTVLSTTARRIHATHIELKPIPSGLSISLFDNLTRNPRSHGTADPSPPGPGLVASLHHDPGSLSPTVREQERHVVPPVSSRGPRQAPVRSAPLRSAPGSLAPRMSARPRLACASLAFYQLGTSQAGGPGIGRGGSAALFCQGFCGDYSPRSFSADCGVPAFPPAKVRPMTTPNPSTTQPAATSSATRMLTHWPITATATSGTSGQNHGELTTADGILPSTDRARTYGRSVEPVGHAEHRILK
jgi:hypothetical protein